METELVQVRLEDDVITPGQGRNLAYKYLVKRFRGSLGKYILCMELRDCCLKGFHLLLKNNKEPKEDYIACFQTSFQKERFNIIAKECLSSINYISLHLNSSLNCSKYS